MKSKVKSLDTLFSRIIRMKGECHRCRSKANLQCAHLISRRYQQVRWNLRNAVSLCRSCHVMFTYRPLEWDIYIRSSILPPKTYEELKKKALTIGKIDHKTILEDLKKIEVHHARLKEGT